MEAGIQPPELKSIEEFFTGDIQYKVPKYQRSFAWGPDEIEELWDDILSSVNRGGDYFVGTIVLHNKQSSPQEIIDGQQRLTCISMIFSAIRHIFLASSDDSRAEQLRNAFLSAKDYSRDAPDFPKLVLNEVNNEMYVEYVIYDKNLDQINAALKTKGLSESNRLLLQAYHYFLDKITSEVSKQGTNADDFLVPLIDCLRSTIKLITIPVTSEEDANLFFESLNARGKELAISDLVKNRLYSEAGPQVNRAQQLWEQMESELGRRPIPEFLRHFWIAKKSDSKELLVREKQLYRKITEDVKGKQALTLKLLTDLGKSSRDYASISDYSLWPDNDAYDDAFQSTLDTLSMFRVTQCNPILLNAIQTFESPKDIANTFKIVVNFSFRYFIIGNQSPGILERDSYRIAVGIRTGEYANAKEVADAFRSINPDENFREDFARASMPRARKRLARYILSKLTNFMSTQSSKIGRETIVNPDAKHVTLEHVLPQTPGAIWRASFPKDVEPEDYIYRIGNLTLLTAKINEDAANASYSDKQRLALNGSQLAINQYFRSLKQWGNKEIERRQEELAKTALEVWKL